MKELLQPAIDQAPQMLFLIVPVAVAVLALQAVLLIRRRKS